MSLGRFKRVVFANSENRQDQSRIRRFLIDRDAFLCLPHALFDNIFSEARDHAGYTPVYIIDDSERADIFELATTDYFTFRGRNRSTLLCTLLTTAVMLNVSLNQREVPNKPAMRYHLPIGILFSPPYPANANVVIAALAALTLGIINYFRTILYFGKRRAIVQVGLKTQIVVVLIGCFIITVAILFIATKSSP
jgi:hypothetical protein